MNLDLLFSGWRNFIKVSAPYKTESEINFVVFDNYSIFLQLLEGS